MPQSEKNKLTVYLIKEKIRNHSEIFRNFEELKKEEIGSSGVLYYKNSYTFEPEWVEKFFKDRFNNRISEDNFKIFNASSRAVFLVEVENRLFAVTFGYGYSLLNNDCYEEGFGLKVVLNLVDPEKLRAITKKTLATTFKQSREQIAKVGPIANFGIDIEQDLIQGITGISTDKSFGKTISGKDSLSVSVSVDISNIKDFLKLCLKKYRSRKYKENFDWIEHISEVKDHSLIEALNNKLIEKLSQSDFSKIWMAVPDIIEWHDVKEFRYGGRSNKRPKYDDIYLEDFLNSLSEKEKNEITLDLLKSKSIYCISASTEEVKYHWTAYECMHAEIEDKNEVYILSNKRWFKITKKFVERVNKEYEALLSIRSPIELPECKGEKENEYNKRVADEKNFCLMDGESIPYGGGYSKIEFCDLFSKEYKTLIHVKHYAGSSPLSHLFMQGVISGELVKSDPEFVREVKKKISEQCTIHDLDLNNCHIVFAVISQPKKKFSQFQLPFFSKVTAKNAKTRLQSLGYKISLVMIPNRGRKNES